MCAKSCVWLYYSAEIGSLSCFNLQAKLSKVNCCKCWGNYEGYRLTFLPKIDRCFSVSSLESKWCKLNFVQLCVNYHGHTMETAQFNFDCTLKCNENESVFPPKNVIALERNPPSK